MSQREAWFSGVHHSIPAAQRTAERDAVFRCAPQHTGGAAYRRERRGFPVCTAACRRRSVPPRETRFPVCTITSRWCSPAMSDSQLDAPKGARPQVKTRKEEEPSSTAAHSPTCTDHIAQTHTAHPKHFFGAAKRKYLAFARYRGAKPPHGGPRVRPTVNSPCV